MPGSMTGIDLVEWCDAHRPGLPCVVVSGYTAQPPGRPLKLLRKPYGVAELVAALAQAVEQGAAALEGEP
jgi:hypothetical protein